MDVFDWTKIRKRPEPCELKSKAVDDIIRKLENALQDKALEPPNEGDRTSSEHKRVRTVLRDGDGKNRNSHKHSKRKVQQK